MQLRPPACTPLLLAGPVALQAGEGFPPFGGDRVPVDAHVGKASDDFTPAELDFLATHFNFITIEKHQASHKHGGTEAGFAVALGRHAAWMTK